MPLDDWKLLAAFGDHVPLSQFKPDDTISSLSFSPDGRFLASGDHAGRVVIFRINPGAQKPTVSFVTQVHAHKSKFDYFRSELSEMKVNSVKWIPTQALNPLLLTCNSHDAKLWRFNAAPDLSWTGGDSRKFPVQSRKDYKYTAECVRTYTDNQTEYLLDLLALTDQHSFVMTDVASVRLWDIDRDVPSVPLHRISAQDPEITASALHPVWPFSILVGDDAGVCKMLDMRQQAEDLTPSLSVSTTPHANRRQQIAGCGGVGSLRFSPDGHHFVARRFGDLQVWDVRAPSAPAAKLDVQWFPGQMDWLVSEDFVKDAFKTTFTKSGKIVSGCYSADFLTWDWKAGVSQKQKAVSSRTPRPPPEPGKDFTKRVTVCEGHQASEIVAVVSTASLFLFHGALD
jgi:serine/threonine-protein phosphatase 2A regulatory subunit B